jgi:transposase
MGLYGGLDVHSSNTRVGFLDESGRRVYENRLPNEAQFILKALRPTKDDVVGLVVESTYNWYWLVDALMDAGYRVHLANPSAMKMYEGCKHTDDRHDAFWLADLLRLGILPEGYIYPKEDRPVRDLLRKRSHLVRLRTSLLLSLHGIIARNCGVRLSGSDMKALREDRVSPHLQGNEDLLLAGRVSKEAIDFFTVKIHQIERTVLGRVKLRDEYKGLLTIPGVGKVLGLTIMLETGPVSRFAGAGNYASYCRKVPSVRLSNAKVKGHGNRKNGNKYLAWAFGEAAVLARIFNRRARSYFDRKRQKTHPAAAHNALASKLTKAAYYIMRDQVEFMPEKLFV